MLYNEEWPFTSDASASASLQSPGIYYRHLPPHLATELTAKLLQPLLSENVVYMDVGDRNISAMEYFEIQPLVSLNIEHRKTSGPLLYCYCQ